MSQKDELEKAINELDPEKVAWAYKHNIFQLRDRAVLLQQAAENVMNSKDVKLVENSTNEFLQAVSPVIQVLQSGDYK